MKPRPVLLDMPDHIKKEIADGLESRFDQISLRNVNKTFKTIIGNPEIPMGLNLAERLNSEDGEPRAQMSWYWEKMDEDGEERRTRDYEKIGDKWRVQDKADKEDVDLANLILEDFRKIVTNPFLSTYTFAYFYKKVADLAPNLHSKMLELLRSLETPWTIRSYHVLGEFRPEALEILKFVNKEALVQVNVRDDDRFDYDIETPCIDISVIGNALQGQGFRNRDLEVSINGLCRRLAPLESWWNIPAVLIDFHESTDSTDESANLACLPRIFEHTRQCPTFKAFVIKFSRSSDVLRALGSLGIQWQHNGEFHMAADEANYEVFGALFDGQLFLERVKFRRDEDEDEDEDEDQ